MLGVLTSQLNNDKFGRGWYLLYQQNTLCSKKKRMEAFTFRLLLIDSRTLGTNCALHK